MERCDFLDYTYDAIIGLAYDTMSDSGLPLFDTMMEQGLVAEKLFSFYMSMNTED